MKTPTLCPAVMCHFTDCVILSSLTAVTLLLWDNILLSESHPAQVKAL